MEILDNEKDLDEVTLLNLKNDLDTLFIKILIKLVAVLIDSVDELTFENLIISEKLSLCEDENSTLNSQMSEMSVNISILRLVICKLTKNLVPVRVGSKDSVTLRLSYKRTKDL